MARLAAALLLALFVLGAAAQQQQGAGAEGHKGDKDKDHDWDGDHDWEGKKLVFKGGDVTLKVPANHGLAKVGDNAVYVNDLKCNNKVAGQITWTGVYTSITGQGKVNWLATATFNNFAKACGASASTVIVAGGVAGGVDDESNGSIVVLGAKGARGNGLLSWTADSYIFDLW